MSRGGCRQHQLNFSLEPSEFYPFTLFFQFFGRSAIALAQFLAVLDAIPNAADEDCQKQEKENYACLRFFRITKKAVIADMITVTVVK